MKRERERGEADEGERRDSREGDFTVTVEHDKDRGIVRGREEEKRLRKKDREKALRKEDGLGPSQRAVHLTVFVTVTVRVCAGMSADASEQVHGGLTVPVLELHSFVLLLELISQNQSLLVVCVCEGGPGVPLVLLLQTGPSELS